MSTNESDEDPQRRAHRSVRLGWPVLDAIVALTDTQTRQTIKEKQPDTINLMAELLGHIILGYQQRAKLHFADEQESWAAIFLSHAINSYKCTFDLLAGGYPAQALALLRGVIEDASVVQYIAYHPEEASKLSAILKSMDGKYIKDTVKSAEYRIALEKIGDAALTAAMSSMHDFINILSSFAHSSLYAVSMLTFQEEMREKPTIGSLSFYNEDTFRRTAYAFIGVYPFLVTSLECLVGDQLPPWKSRGHILNEEVLDWVQIQREGRADPQPNQKGVSGVEETQDPEGRISWLALTPARPEDSPREPATTGAHNFANEQVILFLFIGYNIFNADTSALTFHNLGKLFHPKVDQALTQIGIDPRRTDINHLRYFVQAFDYHESTMYEMIFCRIADNYTRYLIDLLSLIYVTKPNTLKAEALSVPIDFVLQFPNREELIYGLAQRLAGERRSIRELARMVKRTMDFTLLGTPAQADEVARIDEERNIIVHNRGIMTNKTIAYPSSGERLRIDFNKLKREASFLAERVRDTDVRAIAKFGLPTVTSADMALLASMLQAMTPSTPPDAQDA